MKNREVMNQIDQMLRQISDVDEQQHTIIMRLLSEVFIEYNTGVKRKVDQKLWDYIDAEVKFQLKK
jgi:predicted nucleic acid-binding protein